MGKRGNTQFKNAVTVNLTDAQVIVLTELMELLEQSRQDVVTDALAMRCEQYGIEWPKAEKRPPGRHKAARNSQGKFTKP